MSIKIKHAYDPPASAGGVRILVDRLWPRGIKKENLRLDAWLKDLAPSDDLRRWFGHDPARWAEFQARYFSELDAMPQALEPIRQAARVGTVTLLFSAHDLDHNNAVALKAYLEK